MLLMANTMKMLKYKSCVSNVGVDYSDSIEGLEKTQKKQASLQIPVSQESWQALPCKTGC